MKNLFHCYFNTNIIKIIVSCELTSNRCIRHMEFDIRWNGILIYPFIFIMKKGAAVIQVHRIMNWELTLRRGFVLLWAVLSKAVNIPLGFLDMRLHEKLTFILLIPKPHQKSQTLHNCPYFTWFNTYSQRNLLSWAWQKRWLFPLPSQLALGAQVWWWLLLKHRLLSCQPKKQLSILITANNFKGSTPPSTILQPRFFEDPGKYIVPDTCDKSGGDLLNGSPACHSSGFC